MLHHDSIRMELAALAGPDAVREGVPFSRLTTMKVGGPATFLVEPADVAAIGRVVRFLASEGLAWTVMGNGSNLIVSDAGYDGVVLRIAERLSDVRVHPGAAPDAGASTSDEVWHVPVRKPDSADLVGTAGPEAHLFDAGSTALVCGAGALLSTVARVAFEHSLAGFEFASGIPGTIGGAVSMNAGAYGGEMCQVVTTTTCLDQSGNVVVLTGSEHDFGYRRSRVQKNGLIVLETTVRLPSGDREAIRALLADLRAKRQEKQPLDMPSAGSVFKRPPGHYAGQLIEEAGLRGFRIGGAQVSEKHCGFIVNAGNATCSDVLALITHIIAAVRERSGITLEPEVRLLGIASDSWP